MRAVHIESGCVTVRETPAPVLTPGFAILRLRLAGICNTDLELQRGYYNFTGVPGHEFVADVVEADDSSWIGRRVVGEINLACRTCSWCERGLGRHCPNRTVLGIVKHPGAFAEFFTLPIANLHMLPNSVPDEVAVFTEPVAAAYEILEQVPVANGSSVAVLGDGKLGLLIAMVLQLHGARVDLYGRHPEKMAIVTDLNIRPFATGKADGTNYPIVVDATGSEDGLAAAIALTEPRGTVVMKSTVARPVCIDMASVIVPEITLVGSRCGRFHDAIPLLLNEKMPVERLVQSTYPLAEAPAAFEQAARKGALKILLRP